MVQKDLRRRAEGAAGDSSRIIKQSSLSIRMRMLRLLFLFCSVFFCFFLNVMCC